MLWNFKFKNFIWLQKYFFGQFIVEILNQLEIFLSIRTCYFDRFDRSIMCKNNSIELVFSSYISRKLSLYTHNRRTSTLYVLHHRTIVKWYHRHSDLLLIFQPIKAQCLVVAELYGHWLKDWKNYRTSILS